MLSCSINKMLNHPETTVYSEYNMSKSVFQIPELEFSENYFRYCNNYALTIINHSIKFIIGKLMKDSAVKI